MHPTPKNQNATCVHHTYLYVVLQCPSKVNFLCATFKTFKNTITCFVKFLAHGSSLSSLLCNIHADMGKLICCKCIYNFLCSMLVLFMIPHVLCAFLYNIYHFWELTY